MCVRLSISSSKKTVFVDLLVAWPMCCSLYCYSSLLQLVGNSQLQFTVPIFFSSLQYSCWLFLLFVVCITFVYFSNSRCLLMLNIVSVAYKSDAAQMSMKWNVMMWSQSNHTTDTHTHTPESKSSIYTTEQNMRRIYAWTSFIISSKNSSADEIDGIWQKRCGWKQRCRDDRRTKKATYAELSNEGRHYSFAVPNINGSAHSNAPNKQRIANDFRCIFMKLYYASLNTLNDSNNKWYVVMYRGLRWACFHIWKTRCENNKKNAICRKQPATNYVRRE